MMRLRFMFLMVLLCNAAAWGDTLLLKDGTSVTGRVIDEGAKFWVKDANGDSQFIPKLSVKSWVKDTEDAPSSSSPASAVNTLKPAEGSASFAQVKYRADRTDTAIAAVGLWQEYIDNKPAAADLIGAQVELRHWQEVLNTDGEKINGKWIWGEEHKKLIEQVADLITQGNQALQNNQTLVGIKKLEDAVKLYPNNFDANFELGYFNLMKGIDGGRNNTNIDAGIRSLETASKIQPESAATLSDLAIGYNFRQKYQLSVQTAYKAVKIQDSKEIVQNLVNSIAGAPPGMQNNSNIRPIVQETMMLASKYGITGKSTEWIWIRPTPAPQAPLQRAGDDDYTKGEPGIFAEGTGFFISDDGYILTNRHVAKPGDYLMVHLADNTLHLGERVIIDDEQDMAVIKINVSQPVPFVRLAGYEHPAVGADVAVFGYPLLDRFGLKSSVKMTRGIVTAWDQDNQLCDVTVDAIVNPGNSGGPMVDHHGNLLALTAMKTIATDGMISTYGLGYSTERIRTFLTKQHDKLAAAHLLPGKDDGPVLSNEELATRISPATVCILMCRGTAPKMDAAGHVPQ